MPLRFFSVVGFLFLAGHAFGAMPVAEQNALVQQYCAVCHSDAVKNGGLSLEHYDAARRDPTLAAMMLTKLNSGAMGAAGNGVPEKAAQQAWLDSTREQAAGADRWFVARDGAVSASIVREVPPRAAGVTVSPAYRLLVSCNATSGAGEMRLSWSPQPQTGRTMSATADGGTPVEYRIDGKESMGNGATVQSGHASVVLSSGNGGKLGFAKQSLTIRDLFDGEVVVFPFAELDSSVRAELSKCF